MATARLVPIIIQVKGDRDAERATRQITNAFKQMKDEGEHTAKSVNSSFSTYFNAQFLAQIARDAFNAFVGQARQFISEAVKLAQDLQSALLGVSSVAAFKGISAEDAQNAVKNLRLVKAGIITVSDASVGLKNLLMSGFGLDRSITLLERFSDTAAFGKQQALSYGEAIRSGTEGIKNQNSILVDNIGITKNLEVILRERGFTIQDLSDKVKGAAAREALYQGVLAESQAQLGDANKLVNTYTGSLAAEETAYQNLERAIGKTVINNAEWVESTRLVAEQLNHQSEALDNADSETSKFANHILSYAASIKAQLIPFAAFLVHLFSGVGYSLDALTVTIYLGITSLTERVVNAITSTVEKALNLVVSAANKTADIINSINRGVGLPLQFGPPMEEIKLPRADYSSGLRNIRDTALSRAGRDFDVAAKLSEEGVTARNRLADARYMADLNRSLGLDSSGHAKQTQEELLKRMQDLSDQARETANNVKGLGSAAKDAEISGLLPVPTSSNQAINQAVKSAADRFGIDERLFFSLISQESQFNPRAVSPKGARGLGQLMPGTAARFGVGRGQVFDVGANVNASAQYFRFLLDHYQGNTDLALAAYNWGEGHVDKFLAQLQGGRNPKLPGETRNYVEAINKFGPFGKPADQNALIRQAGTRLGATLAGGPVSTTAEINLQPLEQRLTLDEQYRKGLVEQFDYEKQLETAVLRRRNLDLEYSQDSQRNTIELANLETDLEKIRRQNADDQFTDQRRLLAAKNEEKDLLVHIQVVQDEIANGPYNESLRIQLGLLENIAAMRKRDEDAIISLNRSQLELADKSIYHAAQADAQVADFLARTKSITDIVAEAKIGVVQTTFDYIDRGLDRATKKLGIFGDAIRQVISDFIKLKLVAPFEKLLGISPTQSQGGGALGGIFGGGPGGTPTFAGGAASLGGGSSSLGQQFLNFIRGGGSAPQYASTAPFLSSLSSLTNEGISAPSPLSGATPFLPLRGGGTAVDTNLLTAIGGGGGKSGIGASLLQFAPFLGLGAGAAVGSRFGIGGQIGGGAIGLGAALGIGNLFGSTALSTVAATLGISMTAVTAGLFGIGAAVLVASILIQRNAAKRRNETARAALNNDTYSAVIQILNNARSGQYSSASAALADFDKIKSDYFSKISGYDSKTKRIATDVWNDTKNGFEYYRPLIKQAADAADLAKVRASKMVPEFKDAGAVWPQIRAMQHLRFADGGTFSGLVPGVYDRRDDKLIRVSGDEVVLTPRQWKPITKYLQAVRVPGFADSGAVKPGVGNRESGVGGDVIIESLSVDVEVGTDFAGKVVSAGGKTSDGRKVIVKAVAAHFR